MKRNAEYAARGYALIHADFAQEERLQAIVGLVVLLSILLHGLTVTPVMRLIDGQQGRAPDGPGRDGDRRS